jgi:hypothetical protein
LAFGHRTPVFGEAQATADIAILPLSDSLRIEFGLMPGLSRTLKHGCLTGRRTAVPAGHGKKYPAIAARQKQALRSA